MARCTHTPTARLDKTERLEPSWATYRARGRVVLWFDGSRREMSADNARRLAAALFIAAEDLGACRK